MIRKNTWWDARLRRQGYRITVPRRAVLEVLNRSEKHLSAEEIYLRIHKIYRNIGLSTVYRVIDLFVDMGLIVRFDFGDGRARYKLSAGSVKKSHNHLICVNCRRIIDYSDLVEEEKEKVQDMHNKISKRYNFSIKSHFVNIYGLCNKCDSKK